MQSNKEIEQLTAQARVLLNNFAVAELKTQEEKLQAQINQSDFWQNENALELMRQLAKVRDDLSQAHALKELLDEQETIEYLLSQEGEIADYQKQYQQVNQQLAQLIDDLQLGQYLAGKYDHLGAIFSVHAGQGGTEAMDWAQMLSRSYQRYFERQNWSHNLIDESRGEEAGIKTISLEINTRLAYGLLKGEAGTHRLVRLSPFNANNLRQTSFALVEVLPLLAQDDHSITLSSSDLSWKFSRSGGAGGQNVNKVNTAVELTYLPLNLTVKCRQERSQEQNKNRALQILKGKLALMKAEQKTKELKDLKGKQTIASWGTQIRNYVLHPYQLVKDTRSGIETTNTQAVLDGDLDIFIKGNLLKLNQQGSR